MRVDWWVGMVVWGVMLVTGFWVGFVGFLFFGVYLLGFVWCVSLVFVFVGLAGFLGVLWLVCSRGGV